MSTMGSQPNALANLAAAAVALNDGGNEVGKKSREDPQAENGGATSPASPQSASTAATDEAPAVATAETSVGHPPAATQQYRYPPPQPRLPPGHHVHHYPPAPYAYPPPPPPHAHHPHPHAYPYHRPHAPVSTRDDVETPKENEDVTMSEATPQQDPSQAAGASEGAGPVKGSPPSPNAGAPAYPPYHGHPPGPHRGYAYPPPYPPRPGPPRRMLSYPGPPPPPRYAYPPGPHGHPPHQVHPHYPPPKVVGSPYYHRSHSVGSYAEYPPPNAPYSQALKSPPSKRSQHEASEASASETAEDIERSNQSVPQLHVRHVTEDEPNSTKMESLTEAANLQAQESSEAKNQDVRTNGAPPASPVVDHEPTEEKQFLQSSPEYKRRASTGKWTAEEDAQLRRAVDANAGKNWKKIALHLPGRTDVQCLHRWQKVLKPGLVKGPWTQAEDATVVELVQKYGQKKWSFIARQLQGRLGKQCRERWYNHLSPDIKKGGWTEAEDKIIVEQHARLGNKWAEISKFLDGRTDNAIKNRWNSTLKKAVDKAAGIEDTPTRSRSKGRKRKPSGSSRKPAKRSNSDASASTSDIMQVDSTDNDAAAALSALASMTPARAAAGSEASSPSSSPISTTKFVSPSPKNHLLGSLRASPDNAESIPQLQLSVQKEEGRQGLDGPSPRTPPRFASLSEASLLLDLNKSSPSPTHETQA